MKLRYFLIELDRPDKVYLVGSTLNGVVKIYFEESTKLQTIEVNVKGKAKTHWNKDDMSHDDIDYYGREYYIQENIKLFGDASGESQMHPSGEFSYPFSVQLGNEIPSSYEGKKGYIRYTTEAFITRPWKFDEGYKQPFTVIRHLDCNKFHQALNPIVDSIDQKIEGFFCCKCSEEGMMSVKLNINKTAFVPGEPLVYEFFVDNRSENDVNDIDLILRQNATFAGESDRVFSSGKYHYHTKKAAFKLFNEKVNIPKNQSQTFRGAATVPALPPSLLEGCNIIELQYNVILVVHNSFTPVKFKHEVIIGTIPTNEGGYQSPAPPTMPENPIGFQSFGGAGNIAAPSDIGMSIQPSVPTALPPSYAECVFGKVDIKENDDNEHTTSQAGWAPSYTYYDWNQRTDYGGPSPMAVTQSTKSYDDI